MAAKLGFAREVRNAFDATCQAPVDAVLEIASVAGSIAIHVGSMVNDIMVQYAQPRPWIILQEGARTRTCRRPCRKEEPGLMNNCRADASDVLRNERRAHARPQRRPGMTDGKSVEKNTRMARGGRDA